MASKTIREAEAAWLMTAGLSGSTDRVPASYGGYLVATSGSRSSSSGTASRAAIAVSGTVKITKLGPPVGVPGHASRSRGRRRATGVLGLQQRRLSGALGGRLFR